MKPSIHVLTLGVADLDRSLAFYRDGLGLPTEGIFGEEFEGGAVVFFNLRDGLILALYPIASIAADTGLPVGGGSLPAFTIGHNVRSREEVDEVLAQAEAAGATFVQSGRDRAWGGYTGHFRDPDGHLWEVVWNPDLIPDE